MTRKIERDAKKIVRMAESCLRKNQQKNPENDNVAFRIGYLVGFFTKHTPPDCRSLFNACLEEAGLLERRVDYERRVRAREEAVAAIRMRADGISDEDLRRQVLRVATWLEGEECKPRGGVL